jgi:threonine dehydrogenase-like Zn-dependent dehydrogenase
LALGLLKENASLLKGFVTHKFPLSQWQQAVQTAIHSGHHKAIKVTMHP